MRYKLTQLILITSIAISLSSCASMTFRVDSLASPKASIETEYILVPGNIGVDPNDLHFREYAGYINDIMQNNGFVMAESAANAQVVVLLAYGIGRPQSHVHSHSLPVYGQTGVSSSSTSGAIGTNTTYTRYVVLDAYDANEFRKSKKMVELWKTTVTSTGRSKDMRLVFPMMAAAMEPYVGSNTGQTLSVEISKDSPALRQLRNGNGKKPAGN